MPEMIMPEITKLYKQIKCVGELIFPIYLLFFFFFTVGHEQQLSQIFWEYKFTRNINDINI